MPPAKNCKVDADVSRRATRARDSAGPQRVCPPDPAARRDQRHAHHAADARRPRRHRQPGSRPRNSKISSPGPKSSRRCAVRTHDVIRYNAGLDERVIYMAVPLMRLRPPLRRALPVPAPGRRRPGRHAVAGLDFHARSGLLAVLAVPLAWRTARGLATPLTATAPRHRALRRRTMGCPRRRFPMPANRPNSPRPSTRWPTLCSAQHQHPDAKQQRAEGRAGQHGRRRAGRRQPGTNHQHEPRLGPAAGARSGPSAGPPPAGGACAMPISAASSAGCWPTRNQSRPTSFCWAIASA